MGTNNRGFTLLELLVTMGIMSMLGVAATSGYHALVRGMNERGIVASVSSALHSAQERAQVDRKRVAVYCYNRLLREPNRNADELGQVAGVLVAVHRIGRISGVRGPYLFDEFGDLDGNYEATADEADLQRDKGMRLYRIGNSSSARMEYSVVSTVTHVPGDGGGERIYLPSMDAETNHYASAFYNLNRSDYEVSGWKAGDGYGFEFIEMQLPEGFIFGRGVPTALGRVEFADGFSIDPDSEENVSIEIWSTAPDANGQPRAWKKVGKASSTKEEV